jgi:hypothetical protein
MKFIVPARTYKKIRLDLTHLKSVSNTGISNMFTKYFFHLQ